MKFCPECGTRVTAGTAKFCTNCGENLPETIPPLDEPIVQARKSTKPRNNEEDEEIIREKMRKNLLLMTLLLVVHQPIH